MDILILHPNFPGQFKERALSLTQCGHQVVFVCQTHYGRTLPGVRKVALAGSQGHESLMSQVRKGVSSSEVRAQQYREGLNSLRAEGFMPSIIISHSGWGCGYFVSDIWPQAILVGYVEWWYTPDGEIYRFNKGCTWPLVKRSGIHARRLSCDNKNRYIGKELSDSQILVAPTYWQRQQLPHGLRSRCHVIHDGVDLRKFKPQSISELAPVITYGTRGMEVMRGFPEFIIEVLNVLQQFPLVSVEIAGEDDICYGGSAPAEGSWGEWAYDKLGGHILSGRVRFVGRLQRNEYVKWLQNSWLHVYLSQPYVASWSLVEAMACGCRIVASDVPPVRELLCSEAATLVDHRAEGWLSTIISKLYECPGLFEQRSLVAREFSARYSLDMANFMWQSLICH